MSNITHIQLDDNEYLIKVKDKPTKKEPNYYRIGNGTMNKHKIQSIDLVEEVMNMSKPAQFLLKLIKDKINWENGYNPVVKIVYKSLTKTEQTYMDKGFKELKEKDLVRRIKQGHYMINPNALIPLDYPEALKIWDSAMK